MTGLGRLYFERNHFVDYLNSGKPIIGLRTATHAFAYNKNKQSPYAKYDFRSPQWPGGFGQQVLGETWVNHHGTRTLVCELGVLLAGEQAFITINGIVAGDASGSIENTVIVHDCGCFDDPNGENDTSTVTTPIQPNADLQINKSATDTSYAGGTITYTIDVINFGPSIAVNTIISDTLHASVTVNPLDLPAVCGLFGNTVRCLVGNLNAGQSVSITFPVTVDPDVIPGSSLENVAEVRSETPDSNPFNNRDDADTSITRAC